LWAGNFDDFFTNVFAVQDSISEKVTASLALKISGSEQQQLAKRYTENTEAYALYLQGRYFHEQISEEGSRKALEFYDQAVRKDPEFALAYAWMTGALFHLVNLNINREENLQKVRLVANKAVQLDPNLADAHEALATVKHFLDWNFAEAETEFKKAIELDPKNADVRTSHALTLSELNRHDEAIQEIKTALQINPVTIYIHNQAAAAFLRARRFDEGVAYAKKAIELKPDNQQAYGLLIRLYVYKSMPEEATAALKKYSEIFPIEKPQFLTALVYHASGKKEEAEKILHEIIAQKKDAENYARYAHIYLLLGDKDRAFEFLEKSFQKRELDILLLGVDPQWGEIRSDARFQDLVRRIGLPQ
jgi:tetratricopeptide (TPR) repeat protein